MRDIGTPWRGLMLLALGAYLPGCDAPSPPRLGDVRDSLGITLWELGAPENLEQVRPSHTVSIGGADSSGDYLFFRVVDALSLPDGRIVVGNSGTGELLVFDPGGGFVGGVGGLGDGPGEFGNLTFLARSSADSVLAFDGRSLRVSVFDSDLILRRQIQLEPSSLAPPRVDGVLDSILITITPDILALRGAGRGRTRYPADLAAVSLEGESLGHLLRLDGPEFFGLEIEGQATSARIPLGANSLYSTTDRHIVIGDTRSSEVRLYGLDAQLEQIVRWSATAEPLSSQMFERELGIDRMSPEDAGSRREALARLPLPQTTPFVTQLIGGEGEIWVQLFTPTDHEQSDWVRIGLTEGEASVVTLPASLRVVDIYGAHVLGVAVDATGVEAIQVFPRP